MIWALFLKPKRLEVMKAERQRKPPHSPKDFREGEVYQMAVASRSYVKKPYYVQIKEVGSNYIVTFIPGYHACRIDSNNWDYHIPRMTYVGNENKHQLLTYNQRGLVRFKREIYE